MAMRSGTGRGPRISPAASGVHGKHDREVQGFISGVLRRSRRHCPITPRGRHGGARVSRGKHGGSRDWPARWLSRLSRRSARNQRRFTQLLAWHRGHLEAAASKISGEAPVGRATLGRIIHIIGEPIDKKEYITTNHFLPIHREAHSFVEQATKQQILVTN